MKHSSLLIFFLSIISAGLCQSGNLNKTPVPVSAAKIGSTPLSKPSPGLQLPVMTCVQRNAIVSPAAGLVIYCQDCGLTGGEPQYYNGTTWLNMSGGPTLPGPVIVVPPPVVVLPPANLAIGDTWGGGKVFYILQPGDPGYSTTALHGLIAAPADQSGGIAWLTNNNAISNIVTTATVTSPAIGTGLANTNTIISFHGPGTYAAKLCADLVLNGFDDWYLPSKDELNKLSINKALIGGMINYYWSSTEDHQDHTLQVWAQYFDFPDARLFWPAQLCRVRAVRSF